MAITYKLPSLIVGDLRRRKREGRKMINYVTHLSSITSVQLSMDRDHHLNDKQIIIPSFISGNIILNNITKQL